MNTTATGRKKRGKGKKRTTSGSVRSSGREKTGELAQREVSEAVDDEEDDEDVGVALLDGEDVNDDAEKKKLS